MAEEPLDDTLRGVGVRLDWPNLPEAVRLGIEHVVGARVVEAESQEGGFSPGLAARVRLSDGRRLFVKADGDALNAESAELNRQEARIAASLPSSVPAPRLLASFDEAGWVALVFEDANGRPPRLPWRRTDLVRVLAALTKLASSLTPSPIVLPVLADSRDFTGFAELREITRSGDSLEDLDPWVVRNLDRLAQAEASWPEATRGETLLHLDIRADNLLFTAGGVLFVDWPHATVGASWVDLLGFLPSVAMQGGPKPWAIFDEHPLGHRAEPAAVISAVAGLAGFFIARGRHPDPPGLPTVRRFQRAQGVEATLWFRHLTGWR